MFLGSLGENSGHPVVSGQHGLEGSSSGVTLPSPLCAQGTQGLGTSHRFR